MKARAFMFAIALGAIGCRMAAEVTGAPVGYQGIDRIQILAKGME